jgi:hypothetical protein
LAGHEKKGLELHVGIAVGAGDWGASSEILIDEGANDALLELVFKIHHVVGKVQVLRDTLGVVDVIERAATVLRGTFTLEFGKAALIPELHGEADDWAALLKQDSSDGGRVYASGHGDGDKAGLKRSGDRERIELKLRGHPASILQGMAQERAAASLL